MISAPNESSALTPINSVYEITYMKKDRGAIICMKSWILKDGTVLKNNTSEYERYILTHKE